MRTTALLLIGVFLLLVCSDHASAQRDEQVFEIDEKIQRMYGTQAYLRDIGILCTGSGSEYPIREDIKEIIKEIEGRIGEIQEEVKIEPLKMGVVFHFLNTRDVEQASKQAQLQIEALNRDFNNKAWTEKHPNDPQGKYLKRAASADITFELAQIENREYGPGIQTLTVIENKWETWDDMKLPDRGGVRAVDPSSNINIWVADLPDHLSSYATSPYVIDEMDGIVIDGAYLQFDDRESTYNQGKTLTHLIGNYLGLYDLWNESQPCSDDYVKDTPIHNAMNFGQPRHRHFSTCLSEKRATEMLMNYMDNTDDEVQTMFTVGQVQRIHAFLSTVRQSLFSKSKNRGI